MNWVSQQMGLTTLLGSGFLAGQGQLFPARVWQPPHNTSIPWALESTFFFLKRSFQTHVAAPSSEWVGAAALPRGGRQWADDFRLPPECCHSRNPGAVPRGADWTSQEIRGGCCGDVGKSLRPSQINPPREGSPDGLADIEWFLGPKRTSEESNAWDRDNVKGQSPQETRGGGKRKMGYF